MTKLDDPQKDEQDLRDMLDIYRSMKNIAKWLPWVVGFLLAIISLLVEFKRLLK